MPAKHSRNAGDKHHFTYHEKQKAGLGTVKQRLGADSQLPFGYCALSMHPAEQPVVTPSGRIYSRECILEYILAKTQELKQQAEQYQLQQMKELKQVEQNAIAAEKEKVNKFLQLQDAVSTASINRQVVKASLNVGSTADDINSGRLVGGSGDTSSVLLLTDGAVGTKRTVTSSSNSSTKALDSVLVEDQHSYKQSRRKIIDDTDDVIKKAELRRISPWVPQFTPQAEETKLKEPPKRPPSPFSGLPLRAKDLTAIELIQEAAATGSHSSTSSVAKFLCPVTRSTITNQKVVLIKSTGAYMTEEAYKQLALPTATCPLTGKRFKTTPGENIVELQAAASGFAASGNVESKIHRPSIN